MKALTLRDVYVEQLSNLYRAETQLIEALPGMIDVPYSSGLIHGIEHQIKRAQERVEFLEEIFSKLAEKPPGEKCQMMTALIACGVEVLKVNATPASMDALFLSVARHIVHYKIAAYKTAETLAVKLGEEEAARLLFASLHEDLDIDDDLAESMRAINAEAEKFQIEMIPTAAVEAA